MTAVGQVTFAPGWSEVPVGARAFRTRVTAPLMVVKVPTDNPRSGPVLDALRMAGLARPAEPGEEDWTCEVRIDADGSLELRDRRGSLHPPYRDDVAGLRRLAGAVKIFAQATGLRRLATERSHPMNAKVAIEFGLVADGVARPLIDHGEVLPNGQLIYLSLRNEDAVPVYVSLLDIGISGRISLLYPATPAGRLLPVKGSLVLGRHELTGVLDGTALSWPDDLTPERARPETILVVITSERQDLSALEQPAIVQIRSGARGSGNPVSPLQDMVDQIGAGTTREIGQNKSSGVLFDVHSIDFEMTP
jgi:hypothetical protein